MTKQILFGAVALGALIAGAAQAADLENVRGGRIGYVLTTLHWATYQTAGAKECPNGFNDGPREQFKILFPEGKRKYSLMETQIARESEGWHPQADNDHGFTFYEPQTKIGLGLNLDGKVGPNDFTSPDGEQGIDNQLYRALGCVRSYRDGQTANDFFDNQEIQKTSYNRSMFEISGVDSLANDDSVEVTWYRGLDALMTDATGENVVPGGSQRIDTRFGKKFIQKMHGKIVDGVLITEPTDITFPWATFGLPADELIRGMRMKLKLTPTGALGLMGGYADIDMWYNQTMRSESTHHQSYGALSPPSLYKAFLRLADGYPDAKTGKNTAISSALRAGFTQVYVLHPDQTVAGDMGTDKQTDFAPVRDAKR
ncbi:MAG: hypothetical protein K1X51_15135 [Rhodospirillaceae bacterium]|nr:hypothetical protein [Rhodospirillaceae bacterium]